MAIDVKPYGNVYKHIVEAVSDNFGKYTIPWKYNKTVNAMLKTAVDEYKADNTYPIQLHEALSDVVLRWCFEGYTQTDKDDFTAIFQSLWKFHKRWMLIAEVNTASKISQMMNKEATDLIANLCGGINQTYDKRKEKITDLFVVVMTHVIDMSLKEPEE